MRLKRVLLGVLIIILSIIMAIFGEIDDAPGAVLIAMIFGIFGLYLIVGSRDLEKTKKKPTRNILSR